MKAEEFATLVAKLAREHEERVAQYRLDRADIEKLMREAADQVEERRPHE